MFLESQIDSVIQKGSIEVICGSMFSGKTEELLRRLKRAELAKLEIAVFKPKIDIRYNNEQIVSHDSNKIKSNAKPPRILMNPGVNLKPRIVQGRNLLRNNSSSNKVNSSK